MTMEELEAAVSGLQQDNSNRLMEQQFGQFQNKFGDGWSGDEGIGRAFFDALGAQDADLEHTAFAGAVEKLVEQCMAETNTLASKLKGFQKQLQDNAEKMQAIQEAASVAGVTPTKAEEVPGEIPPVDESTPSDTSMPPPDGGDPSMPPPDGGDPSMPPPDGGDPSMPPPDMGMLPLGGDMGGAPPPPDMGASPLPPAGGGGAPPMPPPPPPPPPAGVPSDMRVKNVQPKLWRPSKAILSGVINGL